MGINGTGKSTLLKMLAGLEEPDAGEITKANHAVIRYLPQMPEFGEEETVLESVLVTAHRKNQADASGEDYQMWNLESKAKSMLTRLGVYNLRKDEKLIRWRKKTSGSCGSAFNTLRYSAVRRAYQPPGCRYGRVAGRILKGL